MLVKFSWFDCDFDWWREQSDMKFKCKTRQGPFQCEGPQDNFYVSKGKAKRPGRIFRQMCDVIWNAGWTSDPYSVFFFFFLAHSTEHAHQLWLSQFQPHASPPPGICRAFVFKKKKCCNCSMVGPAHLYKSTRWGLGKGAIHCTRPMGQDQNLIQWLKQKIFS